MTSPTRATAADRAYLDLRRTARQDLRPVDELLQPYVLECFLAHLALGRPADQFMLKGGVPSRAASRTSRLSIHL